MDEFEAFWQMAGVIVEKRELKSPKSATWRGFVAKLAGLGMKFEITVSEDQYKGFKEGDRVTWRGKFDQQKDRMLFVLTHMEPASSNPGMPPARPRSVA